MSLAIAGMGWVTPLGSGVPEVWDQLLSGERAAAATLSNPLSSRSYPAFRVCESVLAAMPRHPRLRRASAISKFAVTAGLAALENANVKPAESAERLAIIFAISNGGVIYTRRFYQDIVATGAQTASPLLFPETVFNAPASHLAAILGITGASYTLVGDGAVGILALKMAADLMENDTLDYCLVVGAEEADWLLCDAYNKWRLLRRDGAIEPFSRSPKGMILSEGAGAVVVGRDGPLEIETIIAGHNFRRQREAASCVRKIFAAASPENISLIVASANGTFIDRAESDATLASCPNAIVYAPKATLGESVGAAALWQIISAAQALQTRQLPPPLYLPNGLTLQLSDQHNRSEPFRRALVSTCGMNQQVAGLVLNTRSL